MLGDRVEVQDFIYIMHYTDTTGQQIRQIDRIRRYIKQSKALAEIRLRENLLRSSSLDAMITNLIIGD